MRTCPDCNATTDFIMPADVRCVQWRCRNCGKIDIESTFLKPKVTWSKDKADAALAPYREAKHKAICWGEAADGFLATLFLHAARIPGMCPDEKIERLHEVMRSPMPPGDVVEIGTWWGKSALVLLLLARRYGIGNVLCVDPWKDEELVQGVPSVDAASAALSAGEAFDIFIMSLLPYANEDNETGGDFNYLRQPSLAAGALYEEEKRHGGYLTVASEFPITDYCGRIALLHIDGNHAYDKVKQDVELWTPLVVPGGWIVIDDYDWRHGDGPKRAGDEFLLAHPETRRHFVAGGALFVQVAST